MTAIEGVTNAIMRELQRYTNLVIEEFEAAKQETAKEIQDELKADGQPYKDKSGDYRKGWRIKKQGSGNRTSFIVHNATDYQLTHLLEKGHARRGGGERVPARVHIAPAEEKGIEKFLERTERAIRQR